MKKAISISIALFVISFSSMASGSMELDKNQIKFNEALESYNQSDFQKTEELLNEMTVDISENIKKKALTLNGNNAFQMSEEFLQNPGETEQALESIEKSIGYYKRILQLSEQNENVSHNLELAMLKRKEILSQSEDEQQQQQEDQSTGDQLDELQKKQENLASDSQKGADDHKSSQSDVREETSDLKKSIPLENEELRDQLQKAEDNQNKALEALEQKDFEKAGDYQDRAVEALKNASDSLDGERGQEASESTENSEKPENQRDEIAKSIIESENSRETSSETTGEGFAVDRNW